MIRTAHDDVDGNPVWDLAPGEALVPGVRAWRPLGVGLRCQTWLGWSDRRWMPVVVKLPRPHQVDHPRARRSLEREVRALAGNLHPGLPLLHATDLTAPRPYLVEQFCDGPDLEDLLVTRRVRSASVPGLAVALIAALVPLHVRGLAHLDVKPANVIIAAGRPVLIDFGSARRLGASQPAGQPVGTVGFAAPDQEACAPVSAAMDLYGVGATLRAVWAGRRAWSGRSRRTEDLIDALTAAEPSQRPSLAEALVSAAELGGAGSMWPSWAADGTPGSVLAPTDDGAAYQPGVRVEPRPLQPSNPGVHR